MTSLLLIVSLVQAPIDSRILLREIGAVVVPEHLRITHAGYSAQGLVLTDAYTRRVAFLKDGTLSEVPVIGHDLYPVAVGIDRDGRITIVDSASKNVVQISQQHGGSTLTQNLTRSNAASIPAAVLADRTWVYVVRDSTSAIRCSSQPDRVLHLDNVGSVVLGAKREVAIVVGASPPFPIMEVTTPDCQIRTVSLALSYRFPRLNDLELWASWYPTAVAALDSAYILTFSDRRSDDRIVLVVTQGGEVQRATHFHYPFAIVAADVDTVIAVTRLDKQEVLFYRAVLSPHTPLHKEDR